MKRRLLEPACRKLQAQGVSELLLSLECRCLGQEEIIFRWRSRCWIFEQDSLVWVIMTACSQQLCFAGVWGCLLPPRWSWLCLVDEVWYVWAVSKDENSAGECRARCFEYSYRSEFLRDIVAVLPLDIPVESGQMLSASLFQLGRG